MQRTTILKMVTGLVIVGAMGFGVTTLIPYLASKEKIVAELGQTKQMLRQGFDRNKELVKENQELNDRINRLLQGSQEKEKNLIALRNQLEDQVTKVRELVYGGEESVSGRLFRTRERQFQNLVKSSRDKANQFHQQIEEQENFIHKLEDQIDLQLAELESLQKGAAVEMASFKKEMTSSEAAKSEFELRREIAKQYLGTIEDLLERIERLKAEKPAVASSQPRRLPTYEVGGATKQDSQTVQKLEKELAKERELRKKDRLTFFFNLGVIYTQYQLYRESADVFEKALKIDSNDAGIHYNLGILYDEHLNDKEKAKQHYEKYLSLEPNGIRRSDVEKWLYIARKYGGRHDDARGRSARGAMEHMFLTNASGT